MTLKQEFVNFAVEAGVIRFGNFTLKSGRQSPYFFNAGLFNDGQSLSKLGDFYAKTLQAHNWMEVDALYGPAYKGIPLVSTLATSSYTLFNKNLPYSFNRKEKKDHGEGGVLVGADIEGKSAIIVDDVISAGTSARESIELIKQHGGIPKAMLVAVDRKEKGRNDKSSIQEIEDEFGIPTISIITIYDIMDYIQTNADESLQASVTQYVEQYCIAA